MENTTTPSQPKKKTAWWKWVLGIFVGLYILGKLGGNSSSTTPADSSAASDPLPAVSTSESTPAESVSPPEEKKAKWEYYETENKMGDQVKIASVTATELLEFDFPYNGGSTATFTIRKKKGETDMYVQVSKGQFNSSYDGGRCRIRFDSEPPKTYSFSGSSDNSSDIIFLDSGQGLLGKVKKAKKMVIEAEFYSEGNRQMEFITEGLKW